MRFLYFLVSSSLLIGLVLLIRNVFRKKLAPGVIYALWLIPLLRLMVPFAGWELPVFGTAAEILNTPYKVAAEWLNGEEEAAIDETEAALIEHQKEQLTNGKNVDGTKIYDAVLSEAEFATEHVPEYIEESKKKDVLSNEIDYVWVLSGIWLVGTVLLGSYTMIQNRKLKRTFQEMPIVAEVEGINVCVSSEAKAACLAGMINPKIMITEEIFKNENLYQCVLQHELAHYHQKDHIWNTIKILLCVIYWWNPLVWFAARCVEEDAELACDARVLKDQSMEARKAYGYALLQTLENARNKSRHMVMATSISGSRKSMKRRIEEISQKTSTKRYLLLPVFFVLMTALVLGCGMPTDKSWIQTGEWDMGDTGEMLYSESVYEYSLKSNLKSQLIYYEIYEYGEMVSRSVLGTGEIQDFTGKVKLRHEISKTSDESRFIMESDGIGIEMESPLSTYIDDGGQSFGALQSNEKIEITPEKSLILSADYRTENGTIQTYDCGILSDYTEDDLKEILKDNRVVGFYRIVFSELSAKELYQNYVDLDALEEEQQQGIAILKINNSLYYDTGETGPMGDSGAVGGHIQSTVDENKVPQENEESNFGCIGNPYTWDAGDGMIMVFMDDEEYHVFQRMDEMTSEGMATAWANAFVERNAYALSGMASEEVRKSMVEYALQTKSYLILDFPAHGQCLRHCLII